MALGENETGETFLPPDGVIGGMRVALSVIGGNGVVYEPTGETVTGEDGETIAVREAIAGYHVNMAIDGALPESLVAWQVMPDAPAEVFFGG